MSETKIVPICFGKVTIDKIPPSFIRLGMATDERVNTPTFRLSLDQILTAAKTPDKFLHLDEMIYPFPAFAIRIDRETSDHVFRLSDDENTRRAIEDFGAHVSRVIYSYDPTMRMHQMCQVYDSNTGRHFGVSSFAPGRSDDSLRWWEPDPKLARQLLNIDPVSMEDALFWVNIGGFLCTILHDRCKAYINRAPALTRQQRRALERDQKFPEYEIVLRDGYTSASAAGDIDAVLQHLNRSNPRRHEVAGHLRRYRNPDGTIRKTAEVKTHQRGGRTERVRNYDATRLQEKPHV